MNSAKSSTAAVPHLGTSALPLDAVKELALAVGSAMHALVKSREADLATGPMAGATSRDRLPAR